MKRKTEETSRVTDRCRTCVYRTWIGAGKILDNLACYYTGNTGEARGCPAGDQCTKYVKGEALQSKPGCKRWW